MSQEIMMQILNILHSIQPLGVLESDTLLFDSGYIDSIIIFERLLPVLEDFYNITVEPVDLIPENFETPKAICKYIESKGIEI